jgi:hypothetical protein
MNMRKLNEDDRKLLTAPFSYQEIFKVVTDLKHNSAPGPDGLPAEFFQDFWDLIKKDIWNMCDDFSKGKLDIERLNYGLITLIPKVDNAMEMKKFRPICLLNVCYKIITKSLNNRLSTCINKVISENQYGFIKGKYILDCVVALHEIIHEVKKKKQNGIILKIDFEKAYDKVNWQFLYCMLHQKGFGDKWGDWVMKTVKGGKVAIRTNGMTGPYFPTHKGVRQGDPFSPLLFNIAADGLACLIEKAQEMKLITGLVPHIINNGCAYLQYADDTILLIQDNLEYARNLKFILILFEKMSGLKINFHKSEVYCFGNANNNKEAYAEIFTCPIKKLPICYLGVPIDHKTLSKTQWANTEEKFEKKLGVWQGRYLSLGGRLTLINSSLSNIPLYMLSLYLAPSAVLKKMDTFRKRFLWCGGNNIKKYHLVKWDTVCTEKNKGGFGILNLRWMNISLLTKWLWKLEMEEGLWQTIVRKKYMKGKPLCVLKKNKETLSFGEASWIVSKNIVKTEK